MRAAVQCLELTRIGKVQPSNTAKSSPKARLITSDYTYQSLVDIFTGQDAVVSTVAVGPTIVAQKKVINAAVAAGVKRFIPSECGSSSLDGQLEDFKKLMQPKTPNYRIPPQGGIGESFIYLVLYVGRGLV
jgi:hypothetical protein